MKTNEKGFPIFSRGKRSSPVTYYPEAYFRAHGMKIRNGGLGMFFVEKPSGSISVAVDISADRIRCDQVLAYLGVTVLGEFEYRRKHFK